MWRTLALLTRRCTHSPFPQQSHPRTPGPFPKGSALQGWPQCQLVSCGQDLVQSSGAVAFMVSSGTWTQARMGPFPGWCVCSGLIVLPSVQHPPSPCPVTEPCFQEGGGELCVGDLFLERKWSLGALDVAATAREPPGSHLLSPCGKTTLNASNKRLQSGVTASTSGSE